MIYSVRKKKRSLAEIPQISKLSEWMHNDKMTQAQVLPFFSIFLAAAILP